MPTSEKEVLVSEIKARLNDAGSLLLVDYRGLTVKEMQELPKTVAGAWARLVGSPDQGAPSLAAYNEAKAEHAALNESLFRKGCTSVETASIKH